MAAITSEIVFDTSRPARSLWSDAFRRLSRNKMAIVSIIVIIFFVVIAFAAPLIAPHPPQFQSRDRAGAGGNGGVDLPPAWNSDGKAGYWLGTDGLGRDVLSRIIYGTQVSLAVGFIPMIMIVIIGTFVGLIAGYRGGWIDNLLMRITDVTYAFPSLLFILIMASALYDTEFAKILGGLLLIFTAIAVVGWVDIARLVRGQVLSLREKEYIEAARSIGTPSWRIMLTHLLPNSLGPIIVSSTFAVPGFILTEAFLSFIGIGVKPPTPTWGTIISDGYNAINSTPHEVWVPAICIALLTLAFTFLGDGLRDALDPRMKI